MLKVLKSVLGFHPMVQMSGKSTSSVTRTFSSLACKSACNSIKCTYEKTINDRTEHSGWGTGFARTGRNRIRPEVLFEGREHGNSLARIADSSKS